jgi:hypothetical protein
MINIENQPKLKILYDEMILDKIQLFLSGKESLEASPWPENIEFGLTRTNYSKEVSKQITYPLELRSEDELGRAMNVPQVDLSFTEDASFAVNGVHGILVDVKTGENNKEPHILKINANYNEIMVAKGWTESSLPKTIEFNIFLKYLFHSPISIKAKINLNKNGFVLSPSDLSDAAEYVSEIKGWQSLIVDTHDDFGVKLNPAQIARDAKTKIDQAYSLAPFEYLVILGGAQYIPIQSEEVFNKYIQGYWVGKDYEKHDAPVLDSYYFGTINGADYPQVAVGRIQLNEPSMIINYFKIDSNFGGNLKVAFALFPDDKLTSLESNNKKIEEFKKKSPESAIPIDLVNKKSELEKDIREKG